MRKIKSHQCHRIIHGTKKVLRAPLSTDIRTLPFFCNNKRLVISLVLAVSFVTLLGLQARQAGINMLYGDKKAVGALEDVQITTSEPKMGTFEGTGTHFELSDSQYLNITVDSTESIELSLESAPEIIIMRLAKGSTGAETTNITIGGMLPSKTYHMYSDGYEDYKTFTSDSSGKFTYAQDLTENHLIFIQPRPSTKFLRDDATGGDCSSFGTWDSATRTCLLNSNLTETVEIAGNNITLDGNRYKLSGSGTGNGVYFSQRTGIVVRNLGIENFFSGIYAYKSTNSEISQNTISLNTNGIYLDNSSGSRIAGNNVSSNKSMGIKLYYSDSNEINSNTMNLNYYSGIYFSHSNNNTVGNNTASQNNPNIPRTTYQQGGINITNSNNNIFDGNTTNSNYNNGIVIESSVNNTFTGGTVNSNTFYGILSIMSSTNSITGNRLSGNNSDGIYLWGGQGNIISSNNVSGGSHSIALASTNNNTIYNNLFRNANNFSIGTSITNIWNTEKTAGTNIAGGTNLGGNYWTNGSGTGFSDTCADHDGDGICDVIYSMNSLNIDNLPLAKPDTTAPVSTISISGTLGENLWYTSNVRVMLSGTDNAGGTGIAKTEYSFDNADWILFSSAFEFSEEGESVIYYRSIDNSGNIEQVKTYAIKLDKTEPTISGAAISSPNASGWYKQSVTVRFNCSDTISGAENSTVDVVVDTEGINQEALGKCKDRAGNASESSVGGINIDKTAPTASALRSPDANQKGWNNAAVSVAFAASDSLSGISGDPTHATVFDKEGAGQSASFSFSDQAGNSVTVSISNINIDLTDPVITGAPTESPNENGWYDSDVTVHFNANDSLSGLAKVSPDSYLSNEGLNQKSTGTAEDFAGNSAEFTVTGINIDKTAPSISSERSSQPNENGWYNSDVTVKFSASDSLSGVGSVTPDFTVSQEGENQSVKGTAKDKAGNEANMEENDINMDKTAPNITGAATTSPNGEGWYKTDVSIHYTAADSLSGISSVSPDSVISSEGEDQSASGTATDKAGNSASVTVDGINIDRTAPDTLATLLGASDGSCTNSDVQVSLLGNDLLSGIAGISYSLDNGGWLSYLSKLLVSAEGQHILKYYSVDKADNSEDNKSLSFSIEKASQEAVIKFDPQFEDLKVYNMKGEEASYTVISSGKKDEEGKSWDTRKYTLAGCGNNALTLTLKHMKEGNQAKVELISLQYGSGAKMTIKNVKLNAEFSKGKGTSFKELEQKIEAEKLFKVEAKYNSSKNSTEIKIKPEGKGEQKSSAQGMTIIQLVTEKGAFKYKF